LAARRRGRQWRGRSNRQYRCLGNYGLGAIGADSEERARAAFIKGLAEAGYVEGRNVAVEYRWIAGGNTIACPLCCAI
jgi:hypothetical protein